MVCGSPPDVDNFGAMNSVRYFIRRKDDEPSRTPPQSPFRRFNVECLKCGSHRLTLSIGFDEAAGKQRLLLTCSRCHQFEVMKVR
jgi:hypothetical protein